MHVYDIDATLETSEDKNVELEGMSNTQRDDITKFEKVARIAENLQKDEMEKFLQIQKDEMNEEFENKVHIAENMHKEELYSLKLLHSKEIEQLKNNYTQELTSFHTESMEANKFIKQLEHKFKGCNKTKKNFRKS
jgi:hypothetical protein